MANEAAMVAISGYYGMGNAGDEAVLAGITRSFAERCPKAELIALSGDPAGTQMLHGVRAVHRMSPGEVVGVLRKTDMLLSGGGSLLQNVTSSRSLAYYLGIIWLAKRLAKRIMVYAQGVGPIAGAAARRAARSVLNRADLITVRDPESKRYLEELGVNQPDVRVTADPCFAVEPGPAEEAGELLRVKGAPEGMPLIGVSLRPWRDQVDWLPAVARGLETAAARIGAALAFIPMQHDQDLGLSVQVASGLSVPSVVVSERLGPTLVLAVIGRMSLVVGMRLHALMFAASLSVPFTGISYDPKVDSFVRATVGGEPLRVQGLEAGDVAARVMDAWDRRNEVGASLAASAAKVREAAFENADLACRLIGC